MTESNSEQYTSPEMKKLEMEEEGLSILEIMSQLEQLKKLEKNEELDLLADSTKQNKEQTKKMLDFLENKNIIEKNMEEERYDLNKDKLDEIYNKYKTRTEAIKAKEDKKFTIRNAIKKIEENEEVRPTQKSLKKHLDLSRSEAQDLMDYLYSKKVIKKENGRKNVLNKEDNELVQRVLGKELEETEEPEKSKKENGESATKEQKKVEATEQQKAKKKQETQTESLEEKIKSTDEGKRFYDSLMNVPGIELGGSIQKTVVDYLNKKWEGELTSFLDTLKEEGFINEDGEVIKEKVIEKASDYLEENWSYEKDSIDDFDLAWEWAKNHLDEKFDKEELPFSDRIITRFLSADLLATHEDWDDIPEGQLLITQELNKRKDSEEIQEKIIPPVQEGKVYEAEVQSSVKEDDRPVTNFDGMWVVVNGAREEDIGSKKRIRINNVDENIAFGEIVPETGGIYLKRIDEAGRVEFENKKIRVQGDLASSEIEPGDLVDVKVKEMKNGKVKEASLAKDKKDSEQEKELNQEQEKDKFEEDKIEDINKGYEFIKELFEEGKYLEGKRVNLTYLKKKLDQKVLDNLGDTEVLRGNVSKDVESDQSFYVEINSNIDNHETFKDFKSDHQSENSDQEEDEPKKEEDSKEKEKVNDINKAFRLIKENKDKFEGKFPSEELKLSDEVIQRLKDLRLVVDHKGTKDKAQTVPKNEIWLRGSKADIFDEYESFSEYLQEEKGEVQPGSREGWNIDSLEDVKKWLYFISKNIGVKNFEIVDGGIKVEPGVVVRKGNQAKERAINTTPDSDYLKQLMEQDFLDKQREKYIINRSEIDNLINVEELDVYEEFQIEKERPETETEPTEKTKEKTEGVEVTEPIIDQVKNKEAFESIIGHLAEIHEQLKKESIGLLELEETQKSSLMSQFEIFSGERWSEDLDLSQFKQKLEDKSETVGIDNESGYSKEVIDKINEVKAIIKEESYDFVKRSDKYLEELKEIGVSKEDRNKIKNLALELNKQEKYLLRAENDLEDKLLSTKLKFKINKLKEKLDRVGMEVTETLSEQLDEAPAERKKDLIEMHELRSEIAEAVESMNDISVQDLSEFSDKDVLTVLSIGKEKPEKTKEALDKYFDSLYKQEQKDKESNLNVSIEFRNKLAHIKEQLENYTEKESQQGEQEEIEKELEKAKNKLAKLRAEKQELKKGFTGTIKTLLPTQDKKRLKKLEEDLIPEARQELKEVVSEYKANAVDVRLNEINESLLKTISEEVAEYREKSKIKKSLDWMSEKWRSLGSGTRIAIGFGAAGTTGAAATFGGSATAAAAGVGYGGYRLARGAVGAVGGMFGYESLRAKTEKKEEKGADEGVNEILTKLESGKAEVSIEDINEKLLSIYTIATFEGKDPTDDDFSMNEEYEKLNKILEQKEAQIEEAEKKREALEEYVLELDRKIAEAAEDKEVIDKWQKAGGAAYGATIGSGTFGSGVATVAGWSGEAVDGISSWLFGSEPIEESSEEAEEVYTELTKERYGGYTGITEEGAGYTGEAEASSVTIAADETANPEISGIVASEAIEKGESFKGLIDNIASDYGKEELADKIKDSNPDWNPLSDEQAIHNWKVEQTEKFGFSSSAELKYEDFGLAPSSENYKATVDLVFENEEPKLEINVPNDNIDIKDQSKVKKLIESGNLNLLDADGNKADLSSALESNSEVEQGTEEVTSEETISPDEEVTGNSAQNEVIETQFGRINFDYGSEGEVTGLSSEASLSMSNSEMSEEVFGQSDKFNKVFPSDAGLGRESAQSSFKQLIMYDQFYEQMIENGQADSQEGKFLQEKILGQIEEVVQSNDELDYSDFSNDLVSRYNMDIKYSETFSEAVSSAEEAAENTIVVGGEEVELLSGKAEDWSLENPNAEESEKLQEARNKLQGVAGSDNEEDIEEAISEYREAKEAIIKKVQ